MIRSLDRNYSYYNDDVGNKYNINCNSLYKHTDAIELKKIVKNKNDISIIEAIINTFNTYNIVNNTSTHKNIVIKIGNTNRTIEKEYKIGNALEKTHIPGFIKYMCLFNCFDNTYYNINEDIKQPLCSAPHTKDNEKVVLIMPYIAEGSVKNFNWTLQHSNILKSVLSQTVMSLFLAYHTIGFLHNDIHLDNILIKKTKKKHISYEYDNINIPSYGYKIVILDFDSSMINVNKDLTIEFYWSNLENMLSRVNTDLKTKHNTLNTGDIINMVELAQNILSYIGKQKQIKGNYINTLALINMINTSTIRIIKNPFNNLQYNPNIY